MPGGQSWQSCTESCCCAWAAALMVLLLLSALLLTLGRCLPALHAMQDGCAGNGWKWPAEQMSHSALPVGADVPAMQSVHSDDERLALPSLECFRAAQSSHEACPNSA